MSCKIPFGLVPETWACIDCGINTHPGSLNRKQMEQAFALDWNNQGIKIRYDDRTEVYMVKDPVWKAAGMGDFDGCLCIGCREKRIGRTLVPKDFKRNHPFNIMPGTARLLSRRDGLESEPLRAVG
jgi:hypothetical protein